MSRPLLSWHRPRTQTESATILPMWSLCPQSESFTAYDRRYLRLYRALLAAVQDGASIEDLARRYFGFDLRRQRDWALRVTRSHLQRAMWIEEQSTPAVA